MKFLLFMTVVVSSICNLIAMEWSDGKVAYLSAESRLNSMLGEVSIAEGSTAFRLGSLDHTGGLKVETIIQNGNTITYIVDNRIPFKSEIVRTAINLVGFDEKFLDNVPDVESLRKLHTEVEKSLPLTGGVTFYMLKKGEKENWVYARCPATINRKGLEIFEKVFDLFEAARIEKSKKLR